MNGEAIQINLEVLSQRVNYPTTFDHRAPAFFIQQLDLGLLVHCKIISFIADKYDSFLIVENEEWKGYVTFAPEGIIYSKDQNAGNWALTDKNNKFSEFECLSRKFRREGFGYKINNQVIK